MAVEDIKVKNSDGEFESIFPIPMTQGGTGATSRKVAMNNLVYLGVNPIASTSDDTVANWISLGTGWAWYNTNGCLKNQPEKYGYLINISLPDSLGTEVGQIFFITRNIWVRSGNHSGWVSTFNKIVEDTRLVDVYRFQNPSNTGERVWTRYNSSEYTTLTNAGWTNQGRQWSVIA